MSIKSGGRRGNVAQRCADAVVPVAQVMNQAGLKFDPSIYVPAVAGYYTAPNGQKGSAGARNEPVKVLTSRWDIEDAHTLAGYEATGGYQRAVVAALAAAGLSTVLILCNSSFNCSRVSFET